jgi:SHS2 domain-containing protein
VAVEAPDRGALLIDWLNELIYLAETEGFVALEFALSEASDTRLAGRVRGAVLPEPPVHVKAATFHGLRVAEIDGGIEANVILDV